MRSLRNKSFPPLTQMQDLFNYRKAYYHSSGFYSKKIMTIILGRFFQIFVVYVSYIIPISLLS